MVRDFILHNYHCWVVEVSPRPWGTEKEQWEPHLPGHWAPPSPPFFRPSCPSPLLSGGKRDIVTPSRRPILMKGRCGYWNPILEIKKRRRGAWYPCPAERALIESQRRASRSRQHVLSTHCEQDIVLGAQNMKQSQAKPPATAGPACQSQAYSNRLTSKLGGGECRGRNSSEHGKQRWGAAPGLSSPARVGGAASGLSWESIVPLGFICHGGKIKAELNQVSKLGWIKNH